MKKTYLLAAVLMMTVGLLLACVAENPMHEVVIADVEEKLQEEFSEELNNVRRISIFENTLKIYMEPDWPNDTLENFTRRATFYFGHSMREHRLRNVQYFVEVLQDKQVEGSTHRNRQIAEGRFENATDRVYVNLFGIADDRTLFNL